MWILTEQFDDFVYMRSLRRDLIGRQYDGVSHSHARHIGEQITCGLAGRFMGVRIVVVDMNVAVGQHGALTP